MLVEGLRHSKRQVANGQEVKGLLPEQGVGYRETPSSLPPRPGQALSTKPFTEIA